MRFESATLVEVGGNADPLPCRAVRTPDLAATDPAGTAEDEGALRFQRAESDELTLARLQDGEVLWRRPVSKGAPLPRPGAFLLSPTQPSRAHGGGGQATRFGESLLVLGGPTAALHRLDPDTGEETARLGHPWEFRRGFTGPSVWNHHMARFGGEVDSVVDELWDVEGEARAAATEALAERRAEWERERVGWIAEGPSVRQPDDDESHGFHPGAILLVVAVGPREWSRELAETRVLHLGPDLRPRADLPLPGPLVPGASRILDGDLVLVLADGGLLTVTLPEQDELPLFGPGSDDARLRIRSLVRPPEAEATFPPAALVSEALWSGVHFDGTNVWTAGSGARLESWDSHVLTLPLVRLDLRSGRSSPFAIRIPFEGRAVPPGSNFRSSGDRVWSRLPFGATLTGITLEDEQLLVDVHDGAGAHRLAFPLPD